MYALDTSNERLLSIDKSNGQILGSVATNVNLGAVAGMDFDASGTLFVADGGSLGTNRLYTLNTSSGVLTSVGNLGLSNGLSGLAFVPVPEPSAVILLGIGALGVFAHGWRRGMRAS